MTQFKHATKFTASFGNTRNVGRSVEGAAILYSSRSMVQNWVDLRHHYLLCFVALMDPLSLVYII